MQDKRINYKNKKPFTVDRVLTVLIWFLLIVAVLRLAFGVAYFKVYVVGSSMNCTLSGAPDKNTAGGDYVYAFRCSTPRRGDIVIIDTGKMVDGNRKTIIKRVIALGEDTVELKDGVLYLNGEVKSEPYVAAKNNTPQYNNYPETKVPQGYMFCMGDNRNNSTDSRSDIYGCMPVSSTIGVVADWSVTFKNSFTAFNTFFDFTLPNTFGN